MGWTKLVEVQKPHVCELPEIVRDEETGVEGVEFTRFAGSMRSYDMLLGAGSEWVCEKWEDKALPGQARVDTGCGRLYRLGEATEADLTNLTFRLPQTRQVLVWSLIEDDKEVQPECPDHKPVQHRDQKRPWCDNCGRAEDGKMIGAGRVIEMNKKEQD